MAGTNKLFIVYHDAPNSSSICWVKFYIFGNYFNKFAQLDALSIITAQKSLNSL